MAHCMPIILDSYTPLDSCLFAGVSSQTQRKQQQQNGDNTGELTHVNMLLVYPHPLEMGLEAGCRFCPAPAINLFGFARMS